MTSKPTFWRPSRWQSLAACLLLEAAGGTPYLISTWLPQLRAMLSLSDLDGQIIASTGNLGMYLAFIYGIIFDRYGPRATLLLGALASCLGYALTCLAAARAVPHSMPALSAYCFLWSSGSGALDCVAVATTLRNFPRDRGTATGLLKSLFGLSASLFAIVWGGVFRATDVGGLLRFLAIAVPSVCAAAGAALALAPAEAVAAPLGRDGLRRIAFGYCVVGALCVYVLAVTLAQKLGAIEWAPGYAFALGPMLGCLALLGAPEGVGGGSGEGSSGSEASGDAPLLDDSEGAAAESVAGAAAPGGGAGGSSGATLREGVLSLDFVLLSFVLFWGTGGGLTVVNNLGELCASLGGTASNTAVCVVLFGVGNACGRMGFGAASDRYRAWLSRPAFLTVSTVLMGCACACAALLPLACLFPTVALAGVAYGGFWATLGSLVADRWGTASIGSLLSAASLAVAAGSFALSAGLAAAVYSAGAGAGGKCVGGVCFRATFLIIAAGCGLAAVAAVALGRRMRARGVYDGEGAPLPYEAHSGVRGGGGGPRFGVRGLVAL